jgi:hypothetical protein
VWSEKNANRQREAALWEMTKGNEQSAGRHIFGSRTSAEAGAVGSLEYERPADAGREASKRSIIAQQRYDQFGGNNNNNGTLHVTIGAPAGMPVTADARHPMITNAPRIVQPMTGF